MAVYNNGFPIGYQPMYYQQPYQAPSIQPQQNNGVIWVQGEAGMKAYQVAPNTTVALWDTEKQTIYLKSADAVGMPSVKTLDYTIRETAPQTPQQNDQPVYATKDELAALRGQVNKLMSRLDKQQKEG